MANRTVSVNLVANIGQYVSGMNAAAGATMRLGDTATASTKKAQSGFDLAGKGALLMGAAVVGGMAMAVSKSMEFEKAMSAATAATQASGAALGDLRDAAMKAGADTQYSATEAAQAITEMGKAGVSTADILDGGLNGALALAAAGQLDVAKAAEIASVAMTQFKLSGDQLPHVADLLAAGAGKAMGSVEDLGMALNQAGLVASATGISIEETTGTLAAFASAGLIGSDAGTSFRSMLQHLQNPSKESATAMAELGINMYDANGAFVGMTGLAGQLQNQMSGMTQATRDQAMAQIFGSDAVRAANVLYSEGAAGIGEWTMKVNDAGYAVDQAAKLNDNLAGDLERLGGAFDTLMISLGEGAQGPLRELVQMFTGILDVGAGLIGLWNDLPGPVQTAVLAVGAFAALRGPLSSLLTTLHEKSVMGAVGLLDIAQNADRARGSVANLGLAVAEFAVAAAITKAVTDVIEFTHAGDDARAMVDALDASLDGLQGPAKFEANKVAVERLREEMEKHQAVIDEYENYNAVEWALWGQFAQGSTEVHDAREELEVLKAKLDELLNADTGGEAPGWLTSITTAATTTVEVSAEAAEAIQEWRDTLADIGGAFVEPLATYSSLVEAAATKTAEQTESASDSWRDYVGDVDVSLDELATKLEEQLLAQDNWRVNILTITQRGGLEVGQAIAAMGEEGVLLAAAMANGTDAEFNRMADLMIEDARRGGAGAAAELDTHMKVMAEVGARGAGATAAGIAEKLGLGITEVIGIAGQYGVALATGINPILAAVGKAQLALTTARVVGNLRAILPGMAEGGYTGHGGKYEPAGIVHRGEYVLTKEQTSRLGVDQIEQFANGYANGGFVTPAGVPRPPATPFGHPLGAAADGTMQKGYDAVAAFVAAQMEQQSASGGSSTGLLPIMAAARQYVMDTYGIRNIGGFAKRNIIGTNTLSDHGMGKAIDIMTTNLPLGWQIANDFATGPAHKQFKAENVIWQQSISSNGGRFVGMADRGSLTQNHRDHVHVDTYRTGTPYVPKDGLAYLHEGEAVVPASINARSREFSGGGGAGGGGGTGGGLAGLRIAGTLDLGGGLEARIDGRIIGALTSVTDRGAYNG